MGKARYRVEDLASEADVDLDEALVTLWDAGVDVSEPGDLVPRDRLRAAREALGLDDPRAIHQVRYWQDLSGLDDEAFRGRLAEVGVHISPNLRRLPKNSLRRVRQVFGDLRPGTPSEPPSPTPGVHSERSLPPLEWTTIGSTTIRGYLTVDELRSIHEALTNDFASSGDPISPPGVKDENLLDSAVNRPRTSLGGELKYATAEMAAAALFHSVVLNHAFYNGNKRTGLVAMLAFLDRSGLVMECSQEELFKTTLRLAQHGLVPAWADDLSDREVVVLAKWIRSNSRAVSHGEKPMKWHALQRVLTQHGCTLAMASGKGNRMNIERVVTVGIGLFGRARRRSLSTQVACAGPGTEADRSTVHKIRRDLWLDDEHGVDSTGFYEGSAFDAFIIEYRGILRRLGRL